MECERIKRLLSAYLDGELPEDEIREVRKHLFVCSECEWELEKIQNMKRMLNQLGRSIQPRIDYAMNLGILQSQANGHRLREILLLSMVAGIILVLFIFFLPTHKSIVQEINTDTSLGEIHRNLSGDSYDVPKNSGKVVVNFLKQVSNDWE